MSRRDIVERVAVDGNENDKGWFIVIIKKREKKKREERNISLEHFQERKEVGRWFMD